MRDRFRHSHLATPEQLSDAFDLMRQAARKPATWRYKQRECVRKRKLVRAAGTPRTSKHQFVKAMVGTYGIEARIAENLGINRSTVSKLLDRPDWADIRELWLDELNKRMDRAEQAIMDAIGQDMDRSTATMNARWLLQRRKREEYGEETKTIVEGGSKPIKVAAQVLTAQIPVDALELSIEVQRAILEAADAREEKQRQLEMDNGSNNGNNAGEPKR